LGASVAEGAISQIPDYLPACQFAFGCALEKVKGAIDRGVWDGFLYSCLLPNGGNALDFLRQSRAIAPSYKWKIGVETIASEIEIFNRILKLLPNNVKLRLDANGGLTIEEARQWLELADRCDRVEFIEQPLAPHSIDETFALSQSYRTAIALDEAIANFSRLQTWHDLGWTGVYVIKAAIMGSPRLLKDFCADKSLDLVFSSVFETEIGRCDVLKLAAALGNRGRASGFGVEHWLAEEVT
jgi:O-succinylbenzoate synthase